MREGEPRIDQPEYYLGINNPALEAAYELLLSAQNGAIVRISDYLREGADVNVVDLYGNTPLMLAARSGRLAVVRVLLQNGANIDARNAYGETALIQAIHRGNPDVVQALVGFGANLDVQSHTRNLESGDRDTARF